MSLKLQSISQLSPVQYDKDPSALKDKYKALLESNEAYVELSFRQKGSNNIQSYKLDFKQFITDIINAISALESSINSGYVTKSYLDTELKKYVTLVGEQTILSKKTFTADTKFNNKITAKNITTDNITTVNITATGTAELSAEHAKWS